MTFMRSFSSGIKALLHKQQRSLDLDEELHAFQEDSVQEKMRHGMTDGQARRAARVEMGSTETVKHKVRASGWESTAESIWQDIRFSLRMMAKSPGFTAVAILSLALGIGANTSIFTLINNLMLKSLPVTNPQKLVAFGKEFGGGRIAGIPNGPMDLFPYDLYQQLQQQQTFFQGITAFASFPTMVSVRTNTTAAATPSISHLVSGNFFSVLGAEPFLGRALLPSDTESPGRNPVAVVSYRYWQQTLSADPSAIGSAITINGLPFTVVGVMPAKFYGVDLNQESPDLWLPLTMQAEVMQQPTMLTPNGVQWLHFMGRRKPGTNMKQAQAWVTAQAQQYLRDHEAHPLSAKASEQIQKVFVELLPGESGISNLRNLYEQPLHILMGVVILVLLIACANLANFLLARAASREREFSTRLALGSSRIRIVRQILTETLLLSFIGGALGLLLAFWGTRLLIGFVTSGATGGSTALSAAPDLHVLAFTFGISVLTALLFGIAPALRISRIGVAPTLTSNARTAASSGGRSSRLLPNILVTSQVVLSLMLLAVAGLFLRTLRNLEDQDFGFNRTNVLLVNFNPKFAGYKAAQLNGLYDRILSRVEAIPGVKSATLSGAPPISRGNWIAGISIKGYTAAPEEDLSTLINRVGPRFFETMGIAMLQGRPIEAQDTATSPQVVIVNQTLANHFFPHGDAIGRRFTLAEPSVKGEWEIAGIVRDAKYNNPRDVKLERMIYLPVTQLTDDDNYAYFMELRTAGDPVKATAAVRAAFAEIDPNLPILQVRTISQQVGHLMDQDQLISQLSIFFSLLALSLACIGLYGVMSYNVARRTNEIGIRLALGSQPGGVLWMIFKESLLLLAIGIAIGIPATLAAGRMIQSQLFGLSPSDPLTVFAAVLTISFVTLIAAYFPARRATKVDPVVALRYE